MNEHLERWIDDRDRKPRGFRIETSSRKDPDGWHVHIDVIAVYAPPPGYPAGAEVLDNQGYRIGPWPSRRAARKELRGDVRKIVVGVVRKIREAGGTIERFDLEVHMPELGRGEH